MDSGELQPEEGGETLVAVLERQAEERRARHAGNAGIAAGEIDPVDGHEANDLAECQRDDGQVVAAQPQHRKAEQDAPEGCQNARQRQADPEPEVVVLRQQGEGVGADGVESDVAEIEQAGETDHDVEAPAEHHVDQDLDGEIVDPLDGAGGTGGSHDEEWKGDQKHNAGDGGGANERSVARIRRGDPRHSRRGEAQPEQVEQPRQEGERHRDGDIAPALIQDQLVGHVLIGSQREDGKRQTERQQGSAGRILDCRGDGASASRSGMGTGRGHRAQTFSTSGRPSRPDGRNTRTITRIEKVATSL